MKKGKLGVNDYLPVSAEAASRPQTNLSMKAGDKIQVKTAILALVIRSANDVAVVMAEALAGKGAPERSASPNPPWYCWCVPCTMRERVLSTCRW